jgi:hypothetical protein
VASFLKSLEALKPGGATNLGKAIDAVSSAPQPVSPAPAGLSRSPVCVGFIAGA